VTISELKLGFPVRQEELQITNRQITDSARSKPLPERAQGVRVLTSCGFRATAPAEVAVEQLKKLLGDGE